MERTICGLEWKQMVEYGKYKMKTNLTFLQSKHIANLEKVVDNCTICIQKLRER